MLRSGCRGFVGFRVKGLCRPKVASCLSFSLGSRRMRLWGESRS